MQQHRITKTNPIPMAHLIPGLPITRIKGVPIGIRSSQTIETVRTYIRRNLEHQNPFPIGEILIKTSSGRFTIPSQIITYIENLMKILNINEEIGFLLEKGEDDIVYMRLKKLGASHDRIYHLDKNSRISLPSEMVDHLGKDKVFIGIDIKDPSGCTIIIATDIQKSHKPFYKGSLARMLPISEEQNKLINDSFPQGEMPLSTPINIDNNRICIPSHFIKKLKLLNPTGETIKRFISRSQEKGELLLETNLCYDAYNIKQCEVILDGNNRLSIKDTQLEWLGKTSKVQIVRNPHSPFGFIIKAT